MTTTRTIDVHAHILTQETAALISKEVPEVPVSITAVEENTARLDAAGTVYPDFPTGGFDIAQRLRDMDKTGVDVQVLSVTPSTYLYNKDPALTAITASIQNEQLARHVAAHPKRFMAI